MVIIKLCSIALITAICAIILKSQKSDFAPIILVAGGILLFVCGFDYICESISFLKVFTQQTSIDNTIIKLILKVVGIAYLFELTASSIKDLGFESLGDKLLLCGKIIIFSMSIPILTTLFGTISKLIKLT